MAASPLLHNLQERALRFRGFRSQGRDVLQRLANRNRQAVYSIEGLGASGKTALALELAWSIVADPTSYPHRAIAWLPARTPALLPAECSRTPLRGAPELHTLARICRTLGTLLGNPSLLRAGQSTDPAHQLAALHSTLREQAILLVIDEVEQVHPDDEALLYDLLRLLPQPSSAIVTARHYHEFPYPTRLIGLGEHEMRAFIAEECRAAGIQLDPSQQRIVREWAYGLPYAVRVAVSRIQHHGVDRALAEMTRSPDSLVTPVLGRLPQSLRAEHDDSYAGLLRLAQHPIEHGMPRADVLEILDPDPGTATELLKPLAKTNLVVCAQFNGHDRLTIPPLALWYLRSRL